MFILLYMTLKMSFFAKVIRLSLFDDANILYILSKTINITEYIHFIHIV